MILLLNPTTQVIDIQQLLPMSGSDEPGDHLDGRPLGLYLHSLQTNR